MCENSIAHLKFCQRLLVKQTWLIKRLVCELRFSPVYFSIVVLYLIKTSLDWSVLEVSIF